MRSVPFLVLILLYSSIYLSYAKSSCKKSDLLSLNTDCQVEILKKSRLQELLVLFEIDQLSGLVHYVLERRFHQKTIVFASPYFETVETIQITESNDEIRIQHYRIVEQVLKSFGHLIRNVRIEHYFSDKHSKNIYNWVNRYCVSLEILYLKNAMENFKDEFKQPFESVKEVHLDGDLMNLKGFNTLFPAVTNLTVGNIKLSDTKFIEIPFPQLTFLDIEVFELQIAGRITEDVVGSIVRKNEQIQHINLRNASPKLIDKVGKSGRVVEIKSAYDIYDRYDFS